MHTQVYISYLLTYQTPMARDLLLLRMKKQEVQGVNNDGNFTEEKINCRRLYGAIFNVGRFMSSIKFFLRSLPQEMGGLTPMIFPSLEVKVSKTKFEKIMYIHVHVILVHAGVPICQIQAPHKIKYICTCKNMKIEIILFVKVICTRHKIYLKFPTIHKTYKIYKA